jgi:hypothetical protein
MASPACSILQPPGLVVSLDFGTSFSGVAAKALGSDPDVLNNFPYQAGDLTFGWLVTATLPAWEVRTSVHLHEPDDYGQGLDFETRVSR